MKKHAPLFLFLATYALFTQAMNVSFKPEIIALDPRFDRIVPEGSEVERLAHGFTWVEGPVWNTKENSLLFSDVAKNQVFRWKQGEPIKVFLSPSGYTGREQFTGREPGSNGLTLDRNGQLLLCQHGDRKIVRLEADGSTTTIVDRYLGKRLNSPNDLVFDSNGDLYFTDPPFGLPETFNDPGKELDFQGIFRYKPDGSLTLLDRTLKGPNGIAFSPDEKVLYVSDPLQSKWYGFDVSQKGLTRKRVLLNAAPLSSNGPGGPDGIKVDREGNLYTAGPGGLYVISPDGTVLGWIRFGVPVGNCAWGEDGSTLFITANTAVYRVRLAAKGAGSHTSTFTRR